MILPAERSPVTVVDQDGKLWRASVAAIGSAPSFKLRIDFVDRYHFAEVYPSDEGVSWCRGWEGSDVDALKVATGLR